MRATTTFAVAASACFLALGEAGLAEELSIEELRLNGAPAFVVLGVTPTAVEQPTSPRALATSIISSVGGADAGSTLPRNLALEFAPYWWFSHSDVTWEKYQLDDSVGKNLRDTLTFSLATTEVELDDTATMTNRTGTGLGFGFRVNLLKGQPSAEAIAAKDALQTILTDAAGDLPDDPADTVTLGTDFETKYHAALSNYRQAILSRVGFQLELAGAASVVFPEDDFGAGEFHTGGGWITSAYRMDEGPLADFTFVGVGRYLHHEGDTENVTTFDVGVRTVWGVADKPYLFSAEYVQRTSDQDSGSSSRYAANLEYHFANGVVALISVGKDFESFTNGEDDAFLVFGLNMGLLEPAKVAME